MPRPGRERAEDSSEDAALAAALAESAGLTGTGAAGVPRDVDIPQSPEGVSFSSMARLGFAATGPALGSSPGTPFLMHIAPLGIAFQTPVLCSLTSRLT